MSYFPDLSTYSFPPWGPFPKVLTVGWLEPEHPFARGVVPAGFGDRIRALIVEASVNQMRGYHKCAFCAPNTPRQSVMLGGREVWLGAAEVWLPGAEGNALAAPNMIVHYVEEHSYLPPDAFVRATMSPDILQGWSAERELEERMKMIHSR